MPMHLADIASELDRKEQELAGSALFGGDGSSSNVDDTGNFSVQVLRTAMQQHGIDLEPWFQRSGEDDVDPLSEQGFVVNLSDHWFSIRRIGSEWWNLNSTNPKPVFISQFYLSAFLHELREEGYSVFIARGEFPIIGSVLSEEMGPASSGAWYDEEELMNEQLPSRKIGGDAGAKAEQAFAGKGYRLGGEDGVVNPSDFLVEGEELTEEMLLAQAISASLEKSAAVPGEFVGGRKESQSAADMRAKRLAALEKRGL